MHLISLYRIFKTASVSLWRNRWLSLAATLIIVLTLFTISFFISLFFITNKTTETLRSKVDMSVYFEDSTSKDQIFALQNILLARSDIKSVDYVSKEQALDDWRSRNSDNASLRDIISEKENPLPRSLGVKTEKPEDLEKIDELLASTDYKPLIREVSYKKNKNIITRLVNLTNFLKIVGWNLSLVFVLISVLIIYNTIRLTIFARHEEIEIMKLVGASDWYVRGPFLLEGIGYGFLAAVISSIVYFFTFRLSIPDVESYLGLTDLNSRYLGLNVWLLIFIQVIVGLSLGGICSIMAIRKHLK